MCFLLETKGILPFSLAYPISFSASCFVFLFSTSRFLSSLPNSQVLLDDFREMLQNLSQEKRVLSSYFFLQLPRRSWSRADFHVCWLHGAIPAALLLLTRRLTPRPARRQNAFTTYSDFFKHEYEGFHNQSSFCQLLQRVEKAWQKELCFHQMLFIRGKSSWKIEIKRSAWCKNLGNNMHMRDLQNIHGSVHYEKKMHGFQKHFCTKNTYIWLFANSLAHKTLLRS